MLRYPQPCSASPSAPHWLIPTPWPHPLPSSTNAGVAAAAMPAESARATRKQPGPRTVTRLRLANGRLRSVAKGKAGEEDMRIRLTDPDLVDEQIGFLQRSGCLVETFPDGTVEVYLAHDLPE